LSIEKTYPSPRRGEGRVRGTIFRKNKKDGENKKDFHGKWG
jgi:hypothetical protein